MGLFTEDKDKNVQKILVRSGPAASLSLLKSMSDGTASKFGSNLVWVSAKFAWLQSWFCSYHCKIFPSRAETSIDITWQSSFYLAGDVIIRKAEWGQQGSTCGKWVPNWHSEISQVWVLPKQSIRKVRIIVWLLQMWIFSPWGNPEPFWLRTWSEPLTWGGQTCRVFKSQFFFLTLYFFLFVYEVLSRKSSLLFSPNVGFAW